MMGAEDVLTFWFDGDLGAKRELWFKPDPGFDGACGRFRQALDAAIAGGLDDWSETAEGALALIILLDQMSRNLYRGTPAAFAADPKARQCARAAIGRGFDQTVPKAARMFFYLPFEHSEDLANQEESVRLFSGLDAESAGYARGHHDLIRRFGRFPHRNAVLGRTNTEAETAHLADPESRFPGY